MINSNLLVEITYIIETQALADLEFQEWCQPVADIVLLYLLSYRLLIFHGSLYGQSKQITFLGNYKNQLKVCEHFVLFTPRPM